MPSNRTLLIVCAVLIVGVTLLINAIKGLIRRRKGRRTNPLDSNFDEKSAGGADLPYTYFVESKPHDSKKKKSGKKQKKEPDDDTDHFDKNDTKE